MTGSAAVPSAHDVVAGGGAVAPLLVPLLLSSVLCGAYLLGTLRYQRTRLRPWSTWRSAAFLAGTAVLTLALSPAGAALAGSDATGHMAQHVAIGMLAPIGLVLGAPFTLLLATAAPYPRRLLARALASRLVRWLTHPVVAGALNVAGLYLLYLTRLHVLSEEHTALHLLVHLHVLLSGVLFTWAIAGPDPAPRRPGFGMRVTALVLVAGAHGHLGKLLYARADELPPGSGHGVAELRTAAQWMYYGGDLAEVLLAAALFAAWYHSAGHRLRRQEHAARLGRVSG